MKKHNSQGNEFSINDFRNMDIARSHSLNHAKLKGLAQRYLNKISYIDKEHAQLIDIQKDAQGLFDSLDSEFTYDDRKPTELRKVKAIRQKALPGIKYLIYLCDSRKEKTINVYDYLIDMAKKGGGTH